MARCVDRNADSGRWERVPLGSKPPMKTRQTTVRVPIGPTRVLPGLLENNPFLNRHAAIDCFRGNSSSMA